MNQLQKELEKLSNQARFVQMIIDGALVVSKKKKSVLVTELKDRGFKPFPKVAEAVKAGEDEPVVEEEDEPDDSANLSNAYDYLLGMAIWSLTQERVERLRRQIGEKEVEIDALIKLTKEDIWKRDLDDFINEWRFQLEDESNRRRKAARMGRRTSTKLMTGGRAPAAKKRKAALGDDPDDADFGAPKSKKPAAVKEVQPKGGLLNYLNKPPAKAKASPSDGADDSDDDFEMEVVPKKSRGRPKAAPKPAAKPKDEDEDSVAEAMPKPTEPAAKDDDHDGFEVDEVPKKPAANSKPAPKEAEDDDDDDDDDFEMEVVPKKPAATSKPAPKKARDDDDFELEEAPKKGRAATKAKPKPKPKDNDSDDDFLEIAKEASSKPSARSNRKPVKYALSDSESDNGDDLLGDVSKMVKGIGGSGDSTSDSRQLFSERSRPGSSSGLKTSAKASRFTNEFDPDETDYSKLVPQNSPRRSIHVKPKDTKTSEDDVDKDDDMDEDEEPVKPAPKGRTAAKGKSAAAPKAAATGKGRGRPKKEAAKPAAPAAPAQLSPAAKAYASKQAKANPKKKLADDFSDDDIDAMANDILDSPSARKADSDDEPPGRPARQAASRPSRRTAAARKTYVIDDDDSEAEEESAGDDSDDFEESD